MTETTTVNGTECVVIPKEEYEAQQNQIEELKSAQQNQLDGMEATAVKRLLSRLADVEDDDEEDDMTPIELADKAVERIEVLSSNVNGVHNRITNIEDTDTEPEPEPDDDGGTPMERIVNTPEYMVDQLGLTANQNRARNIAKGIRNYAEKAPAGFVIDSSTVNTVQEGSPAHTETVGRIMDFLDDLRKDATDLIKRRGKKMVVFSEDLVDRLETHRCDRGTGETPSRTMMTG